MHSIFWTAILAAMLAHSAMCSADTVFVPVFIDAKSEAKLGAFPYDRAVYADAITAFQKLGAKGVVLKFFLDQPKSKGDDALALVMPKLPVVLQARCDDAEAKPNSLDARFSSVSKQTNVAVACKSGWIPLTQLQKNAADVCFIDQPDVDTPLWRENYQGRAVRTLYECALTLAHKPPPATDASGARKIDLSKAPRLDVISLIDVIDGKIDRARIAGKIVVFGYEGAKSDMFDTAIGKFSAHRLFMMNLLALERLGN